jgi:hypothetical protein
VHFGANVAKHGVGGMAGEARCVGGNAMILEMGRGNVVTVIHVKALPERLHDVA